MRFAVVTVEIERTVPAEEGITPVCEASDTDGTGSEVTVADGRDEDPEEEDLSDFREPSRFLSLSEGIMGKSRKNGKYHN